MPKKENYEKSCRMHKILMGIGIIVFSIVLWLTSSETAIDTNLNWPGAFFILGVIFIVKSLVFPCREK